MRAIKEFLKNFAIGYAVSYATTTLVEENQRKKAESQGRQTLDDQVKEEMYKLGRAMEKLDNGQ